MVEILSADGADQPFDERVRAYPSVRKPALDAPEPIELEFTRDR
jgi:hypothetical protein